MKLGVMMALLGQRKLEEALDYCAKSGLQMVEFCAGNYTGEPHFNVEELLKDDKKAEALKKAVKDRKLEISALSCHGNPLHPDKAFAEANKKVQRNCILLAEKLGVDVVIGFSGCPGDSDSSKYPNWVTCPWPDDYSKILEWQWKEKVIPFWKEEVEFANKHKIKKIALEMHPGFVVYNTESMLKLRSAVGDTIGANFDPSHLFWQGIDPCLSIRKLGPAIFHVHAKDTMIYEANSKVNGVLDTKSYGDEANRSWISRTVGYGHNYDFWKDFVSTLRMIGYDGVLSIEHEDSLMSMNEGFQKAIAFLKEVMMSESKTAMWWA